MIRRTKYSYSVSYNSDTGSRHTDDLTKESWSAAQVAKRMHRIFGRGALCSASPVTPCGARSGFFIVRR